VIASASHLSVDNAAGGTGGAGACIIFIIVVMLLSGGSKVPTVLLFEDCEQYITFSFDQGMIDKIASRLKDGKYAFADPLRLPAYRARMMRIAGIGNDANQVSYIIGVAESLRHVDGQELYAEIIPMTESAYGELLERVQM